MDDQENQRQLYERHLTERHLERFERAIESVRRDIFDLQKSDSRQHLVLMILVAATLGIDIGKFRFLNDVVEPQQQRIQQLENHLNQHEIGAIE